MASTKHPFLGSPSSQALHNLAYTNCKTRIINLRELSIPEHASEGEYRRIYSTYINARPKSRTAEDLEAAVQSLTGGIAPPVAFPTETVYGLGADATNSPSVSGIFAAKGRPSDNPLIVHVASKEHLERLTGQPIPKIYEQLVKVYWPGALTILVTIPETGSTFATNVHPGQRTIGFRVPSSKYARFLISACDRPIAAPSANSSGKPSPTTAQHVFDDLNGKINFILDGGNCDVGVESTVVDGLSDPPMILRPGGVSRRDLIQFGQKTRSAWQRVAIGYKEHAHESEPEVQQQYQDQGQPTNDNGIPSVGRITNGGSCDGDTEKASGIATPRAPGMKYKHYAPQGRLLLFESPSSIDTVHHRFAALLKEAILPTKTTIVNGDAQQSAATEESSSPSVARSSSSKPLALTIAILTTNSWAEFAGLNEMASAQTNGELATPEVGSATTRKGDESVLKCTTIPSPVCNPSSKHGHSSVNLYSLSLGQSPTEIAHSLFSALRTCDDLGANYILAEAPARLDGHEGRDWEVVMERMGKAASEVIKS